jgi:hypothetical protein
MLTLAPKLQRRSTAYKEGRGDFAEEFFVSLRLMSLDVIPLFPQIPPNPGSDNIYRNHNELHF